MSKLHTIHPVLSEKTYSQSGNKVYAVMVPKDANKHSVARTIEETFEVKVKTVNILNQLGKSKRTVSIFGKRADNKNGKRSDYKKAYVTLVEGSLPFFQAIEDEEKRVEENQKQIDKAAEKQNAKEAKKTKKDKESK
jgi:large subunit ribosomal protein L23